MVHRPRVGRVQDLLLPVAGEGHVDVTLGDLAPAVAVAVHPGGEAGGGREGRKEGEINWQLASEAAARRGEDKGWMGGRLDEAAGIEKKNFYGLSRTYL